MNLSAKEYAFSLWNNMPEFIQNKKQPFRKTKIRINNDILFIRFDCLDDFDGFIGLGANYQNGEFIFNSRSALQDISGQKITEKTKSIWFPYKSHWGGVKHKYISDRKSECRFPVYIVSKGRAKNGLTTKALNKMGVVHYIVVESSEYEDYIKETNAEILVLPNSYLENYDTCDDLGNSKSKGPGAARNFCIDHSLNNGFKKHWVMDDNLDAFHYLNRNEKLEVESAETLIAAENFIDRFSNIPVSGLNYYSFCKSTDAVPPFVLNTRIYSCLLIDSSFGYRWRGRYNEDTDLSLRVLKDGYCTLQFNTFLCGKVTTQRMSGGNTKEFYSKEGTKSKSEMLEYLHPDVAKVVWKFNRWHHNVNYKNFKANKLEMNADKNKDDEYRFIKISKT